MENEWVEKTLDEITEFIYDCPHSTPEWTDNGVVVLRNQNIRNGKLDLSVPSFTNEKGYEDRIKRAKPQEGDIVLTREAPMGEVCIIPKGLKCCLGQRVVLIRCNPKVCDSRFILFSFQSEHVQHQIGWNEGTGTTVSNIRIPNIKSFKFKLPPLPIQKSIAYILGSLDDKIELNRRMNQTLEQMAQALFKSWFVDFDPVIDNALAAGNPIPDELQERAQARQALGNNRKPLPAHVQQLFPCEFEFSEVLEKWVPRGWRVGKISDVADVIGGGTPSTIIPEYFSEDGIAWLSPKDLSGFNGKFIGKGATDITTLGLKNSSAKLMPAGTVLFSSRAPIGYVAIAENEVTTNQGFKSLIPLEGMCSEYLYYYLKANKDGIEAIATGSTFKEVSGTAMKSLDILVPDSKIIDHYARMTNDWNKRRLKYHKEITTLVQIRDSILPKLINGSIPIQPIFS